MLSKYVASFAWTSTRNIWNAENTIWSRAFGPSIVRYLITRVLTIYHVKLKQSTAIEEKYFDLRSLSPALPNLWLLLVDSLKMRSWREKMLMNHNEKKILLLGQTFCFREKIFSIWPSLVPRISLLLVPRTPGHGKKRSMRRKWLNFVSPDLKSVNSIHTYDVSMKAEVHLTTMTKNAKPKTREIKYQ